MLPLYGDPRLMYYVFNAIRTGQLDMMLLSQIPYGAEMQMVATHFFLYWSDRIVFVVRQSRLHQQMVKEQNELKNAQDLQQAETLNALGKTRCHNRMDGSTVHSNRIPTVFLKPPYQRYSIPLI